MYSGDEKRYRKDDRKKNSEKNTNVMCKVQDFTEEILDKIMIGKLIKLFYNVAYVCVSSFFLFFYLYVFVTAQIQQ